MDYLNQTIVFLSQQNNELKQKIRKLQNICSHVVQTNNIAHTNSTNDLDQWQLSSPKSSKYEPQNTSKALQTQINSLKTELSIATSQLHQTQLQVLTKTNKIKELSAQLSKAKDQIQYLKKEIVKEKENMKIFYETTVVGEISQKFKEDLKQKQKLWKKQKDRLEEQARDLKVKIQIKQKIIFQTKNQLSSKQSKEERLLSIIKDLKTLLHSSSSEHNEQISQLASALTHANSQLTHFKQSYAQISRQIQQKQHQNQMFELEIKRLTKELTSIKRQHERSLSKTQRDLLRQKSVSKNIEKQYTLEKKVLEAQLKKKEEKEKYMMKKQKELISKIKTMEGSENSMLGINQNTKNLDLSSLSSIDMNGNPERVSTRKSSHQSKSPVHRLAKDEKSFQRDQKSSFTKYLQLSPINSPEGSNTQFLAQENQNKPSVKQRIVSSKATTPKSIVKLKSNTINVINKDKPKYALAQTAQTSNKQTPSTSRAASNLDETSIKSHSNSVSLKHAKYHNQTVTEFSLTPNEENELNDCSSIDLLKDNMSYFPSNKTSKQTSPQKKPQTQTIDNEKNGNLSLNDQIQELRRLQHYMRTSFNPNHNNFSKNHQHVSLIPQTATEKQRIFQEELISKLLKTQESNQKQSRNTQKGKPEEIEELLTSTQRHFRADNYGKKRQISFKKNENEPFSSVSIVESNQKQPVYETQSINRKSVPELNFSIDGRSDQNLYKPNKELMKLADLDTPCFESSSSLIESSRIEPQITKTHLDQPFDPYKVNLKEKIESERVKRKISVNISHRTPIQTNSKR